MFRLSYLVVMLILTSCTLSDAAEPIPATTQVLPTLTTGPWRDARTVMEGVCFEAALALADQPIILRTGLEHIQLYDQIDGLALCRQPVLRVPFDFTQGAALVGVWSSGRGCTAAHQVLTVDRAPEAITVRLDFSTDGDCDYELIRPFWIAIEEVGSLPIALVVE